MPKSYEWLALYFMRPQKNLGHLIKCLDIFFLGRTNSTELNKKKKAGKAYLAPQARPNLPWPGPAHPRTVVVFFPIEPSCSVEAGRGRGATSTPRGSQPPWTSSPRQETR